MAFIASAAATAVAAGATAYTANKQSKSAKQAIASQERIAQKQISAAKEGEVLASETAKNKLKLKQASQTRTILTSPLGIQTDDEQINSRTLGV